MKIELSIEYFEENGTIVALCPELQVSSFGSTLEEAERSIMEALDLFFEGCETLGTLEEVLEEAGFRQVDDTWVHRKPIKTMTTTLNRSAGTVSYA
jgi:predicted RNase H-like HicB family nuclease